MHIENFLKFHTAYVMDKVPAHFPQERSRTSEPQADTLTAVFRIDKFMVPADALSAFIEKMTQIQSTLRTLPGCLRVLTLKQTGGAGEFNVVTFVEWANAGAVRNATSTMQKKFADDGFDPALFTKSLKVRGDLGFYDAVGGEKRA